MLACPIRTIDNSDSFHLLYNLSSWYCRYATILAFDVKVERDANELADNLGVKIFTADIIYHLFDSFTKYQVIVMIIIVI